MIRRHFLNGNDAYIMTSDTNPEVLAVCYAQGWCRDEEYMTKSEAAAVTNADFGTVFKGNTSITHFDELEHFVGLTSITSGSFSGCSNLTTIKIPTTVRSIGSTAFNNCSGLTKVIINDIAAWCKISFGDNTANPLYYARHIYRDDNTEITSLVIPSSVATINGRAFEYCYGLTSISIPNSVKTINNYAFQSCTNLTSITIPASVTTISTGVFNNCRSIESITVDSNNTTFDSRNDCNAIIKKSNNQLVYGCRNTDIPSNVKSIGQYAFYGHTGLTSITIPSGVTSIGAYAFYNTRLISITIPSGVTVINNSLFNSCSNLETVVFEGNVTSIGNSVFQSCTSLASVTLPDTITTIGQTFDGCTNLVSVHMPSNLTSIGQYCFRNCKKLVDITIPSGVTSISISAFQYCESLTSITIPEGVTKIDAATFSGCKGMLSFTLPSTLTSVASNAFKDNTSLQTITCYATTAPSLVNNAFGGIKTGGTLYVPAGSTGYDVWMGTGNYYLGHYNWTKVEMQS